jgi:hypothetical protein
MPAVVAEVAGLPNHPGDPLQGPQGRGKAPRDGTFQPGRFQALPRRRIQAWFAASSAVARPGTIPAMRGGATDLETADNLGLWVAPGEQPGGFHPTGFQEREVPPRPKSPVHAPRSTRTTEELLVYSANIVS